MIVLVRTSLPLVRKRIMHSYERTLSNYTFSCTFRVLFETLRL
jgi:hypothetical protein